jgi:DNA-binding MarR family transcriptional regulator
MRKRPSHSHLQNRILLYMEYNKIDSLAGLARELDAHRSSVSRAMHALQAIGLVSKVDGDWSLTPTGEEEVQRVRRQLPERTTKAAETVNRLIEQGRLAALASDAMALGVASPYTAVSEAAKLTLSAAAQESIQSLISSVTSIDSLALAREAVQPLMDAAARVDLLASTEEAIQSLAGVVARVDSLTLSQEATQPLMNTAASVELLASAQEAMQSVASVAARFDSSVLTREAIQPLMDAAVRFDSLVLAQEAIQSFENLATGVDSLSLAQEAIQPLVSAAARFDSIALAQAQESTQSLIKATEEVDLLTSAQGRTGVLTSMTAEFLSGASALEIMSSAQLTSALDSIKSISLKPTITEIAAGQALQTMGDYAQSVVADLCPQLAQEALASFSQSQRLSLASIEQVSVLGDAASSIIKEFGEVNLGLSDIINDLGTLTMQGQTIKSSVAALMPNVAEIARTYKGFLADVVGGLDKSLIDHRVDVGIVVPTRTTSAYVGSVKATIVVDEADVEEVALPEASRVPWRDRAAQLDDVFRALGPNHIAMWHGSWAVLDSHSPDRIRQAAHSGRELLMQVLAELAPDSVFGVAEIEKYGHQGTVTRKMRVKKILIGASESAVSWVDAVAKALEETYRRLVAASHDRGTYPRATEQQIAGLLYALGGLLSFVDAYRHKNTDES